MDQVKFFKGCLLQILYGPFFNILTHMCALRDLVPCAQFKNVKNIHGGVLLSVKLQAEACNFTKSNTTPWVFFTLFKLYEWYQIAQSTTCDTTIKFLLVFPWWPRHWGTCSINKWPTKTLQKSENWFLCHNFIKRIWIPPKIYWKLRITIIYTLDNIF